MLAVNPNKRGKQVPVIKLKDIGSKVTSTRKLEKCGSSFSVSEVGNSTVQEPKPFKKLQFNSRCPTAHTGFSFSIMRFLSAIRTAMITPDAKDDPSAFSKYPAKSNPKSISRYHKRKGISNSQGEQKILPCLASRYA